MDIAQQSLNLAQQSPWRADWIWGCPMIILTVIVHTLGLFTITRWAVRRYDKGKSNHPYTLAVFTICVFTLIATILHGFETGLWAILYRALGALPNTRSAMLYSLSAVTTYGHNSIYLEDRWQLLGAIEALNGILLFGLSTAYLFGLIQIVSPKLRSSS
jgi:hypothetical protein